MSDIRLVERIFKGMVAVIAIAVISFLLIERNYCTKKDIVYDTIFDTVRYDVAVLRDSVVIRDSLVVRYETRLLETVDKKDSVLVNVPITQKVYSDNRFRAYVSGYNPSLDSMFIFAPKVVKREFIPPKRWSFGVSAGYGITPKGFQPYIGLSINYRLSLGRKRGK